MNTETSENKRPLSIGDIVQGAEFTLAQTISVDEFNLRVGDVIKVEQVWETPDFRTGTPSSVN